MSIKVLCSDCAKTSECKEPLPSTDCGDCEKKITNAEILKLFHGTSKTMQKSIIEILKVTQNRKELNETKTVRNE